MGVDHGCVPFLVTALLTSYGERFLLTRSVELRTPHVLDKSSLHALYRSAPATNSQARSCSVVSIAHPCLNFRHLTGPVRHSCCRSCRPSKTGAGSFQAHHPILKSLLSLARTAQANDCELLAPQALKARTWRSKFFLGAKYALDLRWHRNQLAEFLDGVLRANHPVQQSGLGDRGLPAHHFGSIFGPKSRRFRSKTAHQAA